MISLFVTMIVIAIVAGIFWWAIGALPFIPPPIAQGIQVCIVVVAALYILSFLLAHTHGLYIGTRP